MSYPEWYAKASAPFRGRVALWLFRLFHCALIGAFVGEYTAIVCALFYKRHYLDLIDYDIAPSFQNISPIAAIVIPSFAVILTLVVRKALDKPRPFDAYDVQPLFAREIAKARKHGKSLPSLSMTCATMTALLTGVSWQEPRVYAVQVLLCAAFAFTTIVGGEHFPRDIAFSVALSLVCGLVGFAIVL